jgi:hypothetical protein
MYSFCACENLRQIFYVNSSAVSMEVDRTCKVNFSQFPRFEFLSSNCTGFALTYAINKLRDFLNS